MKLSKKQLIKLIEMAFKGVKDPIRSQPDGNFSAVGSELGDMDLGLEASKDRVAKYFKSSKFSKQAEKFYGDRNFPGSNTWVVPFLGNEYEAYGNIILGNESYPDYENGLQKVPGIPQLGGGGGDRMMTYPMTPEIIERLGLEIGGNNGVNLTNDIIFVPIATILRRDFVPSVHMIIHAIFDQLGVEDGMPLMNEVIEELADLSFDHYYSERSNPVPTIQPGTTASLRRGPQSPPDFVAEVLAGAILYINGIEGLPFNNDLKQRINDAVEEFRNHIKGKVVIITVA
tara:strand:- start:467 stop:1324 length:858 start_codon:yes stop_codon:yes gene_type:complete